MLVCCAAAVIIASTSVLNCESTNLVLRLTSDIKIRCAQDILSNAVANIGLSFIDCGGSQELHTRWQSLPVCVAGRDGLVREVNFGERILAKLYQFEAQDAREWVEKFGEREKLRFADKTTQRRTSVWDYASGKSYPIRLKQECYQHLNRKNGFTITYYGVVEIDAIRGGLMVERIAKDILHSVPEGTLRIAKNAEE